MKAGSEIHFLAGQLFTIGVALLAVAPRMPFDTTTNIGGKLSFPFRRAVLGLVALGTSRVLFCHVLFPGLATLDSVLGVVHVVGQCFLCLTTAYLLQVQLSLVTNIVPGASLVPILLAVAVLAPIGAILAHFLSPNLWCLLNVAEGLSSYSVLQTLHEYASVTAPGSNGRGPYLTQLVRMTEYWFLATCTLAFLGEATHGYILTRFDHYDDRNVQDEAHTIVVLLEAFRHNQDSGIDDWTRLLVHSIFLNSLDELQHFTSSGASPKNSATAFHDAETGFSDDDYDDITGDHYARRTSANNEAAMTLLAEQMQITPLRSRRL